MSRVTNVRNDPSRGIDIAQLKAANRIPDQVMDAAVDVNLPSHTIRSGHRIPPSNRASRRLSRWKFAAVVVLLSSISRQRCFRPWIFQSRDIIQTVMIESLEKRLKHLFQAWEALTPAQQVHATIVANGTIYTQAEIVEM